MTPWLAWRAVRGRRAFRGEVLEGAAGLVEKSERLTFNDTYLYKGLAHLILSAGYNLMTAHLDSVIFRAWAAFDDVSTRSAVAGSAEEVTEGVTPIVLSEGKQNLLQQVQVVGIANSVEVATEEQEDAPEKVYIVPELNQGAAVQIQDGMTVERIFVPKELS